MDAIELIKKHGLRRGLSIRTITTYCSCVKLFFRFCKKDPRKVTMKDIQDYIDDLIERGMSYNTVNLNMNALKFSFREIMKRRFFVNMKCAKTRKRLPTFLTQEEILNLFDAIKNQKHRLMIELLYSGGLRLSELVNLRVKDLELSKNYGWVRKGKGNKDRYFMIAERIKPKLMAHMVENNLSYWNYVFSGWKGHISIRTIQVIVKKAAQRAKIQKNVHPHTLRHSFATHLIENGYGGKEVKELLGHQSIETTMNYVHMASPKILDVRSPLDSL